MSFIHHATSSRLFFTAKRTTLWWSLHETVLYRSVVIVLSGIYILYKYQKTGLQDDLITYAFEDAHCTVIRASVPGFSLHVALYSTQTVQLSPTNRTNDPSKLVRQCINGSGGGISQLIMLLLLLLKIEQFPIGDVIIIFTQHVQDCPGQGHSY